MHDDFIFSVVPRYSESECVRFQIVDLRNEALGVTL